MSYTGLRLDPLAFLQDVEKEASHAGFEITTIGTVQNYPIFWLEHSASHKEAPRVLLSAGVHGDEPAGPLTMLKLLKDNWFASQHDIHWMISPMLNPTGFHANTRENHAGIDLNRDFLQTRSTEVEQLKAKLENTRPCDVALLLHEDWESSGFYLYDLSSNPNRLLAKMIVTEVAKVALIDTDEEIDGMAANGGIISVDIDQAESDTKLQGLWPEAFYLVRKKMAIQQYTLESASALEIEARIRSLETAIKTAIN